MQPHGPDPEPVPPIAPAASRPWWPILLTPAAIVVGCALIAAGLFLGLKRDGLGAAEVESAVGRAFAAQPTVASGPVGAVSTAPPSGALSRLSDALISYAKSVALDVPKFQACVAKPETLALLNKHFQRGVSLGVEGTPTFFINNKRLVGAQPAAVFDEIVQAELSGSPTTLDGYSAAVKQLAASGRFEITADKVDVTDAQIKGSRSAKVVIAEFSDFQCPFCKTWTDQYLAKLRTQLGENVALAFVHFPIVQIHPHAGTAGAAAICAGEQGKFWEMHDLLFSKQKEWAALP